MPSDTSIITSTSVLCVFVLLLFLPPSSIFGQRTSDVFRVELFPEQLMQQDLIHKQSAIQNQLQELQRQYQVNQQNAVFVESLNARKDMLFQEFTNIQNQLLRLQEILQEKVAGTRVRYKDAVSPAPNFLDFISRSDSPRPVTQIVENELPSSDDGTPVVTVQAEIPCSSTVTGRGFCRPLVRCALFYADIPELRKQPCVLREGVFGVCCPERIAEDHFGTGRTGVLQAPPPPVVIVPSFTPQQIEDTVLKALEKIENRKSLISNLFTHRILLQKNTPAAGHQKLFPTTNETLEIGEGAQKSVEASVELVNDFMLSRDQGTFALPKFSILNTTLADTCPKQSFCHAHKYRATDGSCNNINHQRWGTPGTALQRILPPKYGDGVNSPRSQAESGSPLPSARLVSSSFALGEDSPSENYTLLLMQWGQFLDHDLTHTPISRGQSGFGISCCRDGRPIDSSLRHPDCFAIELPADDHIFAQFGERCMEFVRSLPAPRPECNFGPREQMNQITGFLDGSNVYASSLDTQRGLRTQQGGRLQSQNFRGRQLLPANSNECSSEQLSCFRAGDGRVNEQIELALIHTIWMREHNRIAGALARLRPRWSDEAVFQETRRIVIAELQHITYNEFLPIILGERYVQDFQLRPKDSGWTKLYDPEINPSITNVFAAAAFRFGHTLIQSSIHSYGKFGNIRENLQLSKQHFAPFPLYREQGIDDFVRGITFQSVQNCDRFFSPEITDHLFQGDLSFGLDLVALNVQRGRDHGLPPYNDWREVCGLKRARNWKDLEEMMDGQSVQNLRELYKNVDEVDLFIGAIAERPLPGALLGPTFVCLNGDQFARLRRGDRFFYEEGDQPSSFSEAQLNEIRKVSLARILCDNSDNIVLMQPLAFVKPTSINQRVPCDSQAIPRVDLRAWLNEQSAVP